MPIRFLRLPALKAAMGLGTTSVYGEIKEGRLTPGVKLTARSVGWPVHEVDVLNAARLAGKSDEELRQLVSQLVAARAQALPAVLRSSQVGQAA